MSGQQVQPTPNGPGHVFGDDEQAMRMSEALTAL